MSDLPARPSRPPYSFTVEGEAGSGYLTVRIRIGTGRIDMELFASGSTGGFRFDETDHLLMAYAAKGLELLGIPPSRLGHLQPFALLALARHLRLTLDSQARVGALQLGDLELPAGETKGIGYRLRVIAPPGVAPSG